MDQTTYMQNVLKTESKPEKLDIAKVPLDILLLIGINTAEVMNFAKRTMFYRKPEEAMKMREHLQALSNLVGLMDLLVRTDAFNDEELVAKLMQSIPEPVANAKLENINMRLLHGVIGQMSEAGEKLQALQDQFYTGEFDAVNYREEMGDDAWYDAIQKDELRIIGEKYNLPYDFSEGGIRNRNIVKLNDKKNGRYKAGEFTPDAAVNRDTDAERVLLSGDEPNDALKGAVARYNDKIASGELTSEPGGLEDLKLQSE